MERGDSEQTEPPRSCRCSQPSGTTAWCFPGSHHQERLCAHQGAPLPLSQPRERDISAHIGTSLSFCFFSASFSVLPALDAVFRAAVLREAVPAPCRESAFQPGCSAQIRSGGCWHCPWLRLICSEELLPPQLPDASGPSHPLLEVLDFSQ